jgi:hypothetical protein
MIAPKKQMRQLRFFFGFMNYVFVQPLAVHNATRLHRIRILSIRPQNEVVGRGVNE